MSIPKLKAYRLRENYGDTGDDDIQPASSDELIPVALKGQSPHDAEELVGVRMRGDARLVVQGDWDTVRLSMDRTSVEAPRTMPMRCDGWVMGRGNFRLYVRIVKKDGYRDDQSSSPNKDNGWHEVSRKFWDYEVTRRTVYGRKAKEGEKVSNCWVDGVWHEQIDSVTGTPWIESLEDNTEETDEIHEMDFIVFKLGGMLIHSNAYFSGGYGGYVPIVTSEGNEETAKGINAIFVKFRRYCEFGDNIANFAGNSDLLGDGGHFVSKQGVEFSKNNDISRYRVPFGDIYNGNDEGRCLRFKMGDSSYYGPSLPKVKGEDAMNHDRMQYYEGNGFYRRRVMPLRMKVAREKKFQGGTSFVSDAEIVNGECEFAAGENWHFNELMKPVLMERITVDRNNDGMKRSVLKALEPGLQYGMALTSRGEGSNTSYSYKITFDRKYYARGGNGGSAYPCEVFLVYNEVGDSLGGIMDFNYDYRNFNDGLLRPSESEEESEYINKFMEYGYANRGNLMTASPNSESLFVDHAVYVRQDVLAVIPDANYGYDASRDLILNITTNSASFTMTDRIGGTETGYCNELGWGVYVSGKKILERKPNDTGSMTVINHVVDGLTAEVSLSNPSFPKITIKRAEGSPSAELPRDVMFSYHSKRTMGFGKGEGNKNPWCMGYRIPCYEKVKTTDLFVSSFPNWLQGHLDNDLDVFVGNKVYSGASTDKVTIDTMYPCYQKDGWQPLYFEGAVRFNEDVTQMDYFDVFNFATQTAKIEVKQEDWNKFSDPNYTPIYIPPVKENAGFRSYYCKVRYAVAHYESVRPVIRGRMSNYSLANGISHYTLLEDDDYRDCIGRRMVTRTDDGLRTAYECGKLTLPEVRYAGSSGKEIADSVSSVLISGNENKIMRLCLNDDRPQFAMYYPKEIQSNGSIICLNQSGSNGFNEIKIGDVSAEDMRVHVKVGKSDSGEFLFSIGRESKNGDGYRYPGQADKPERADALFDESQYPVDWCEIPSMDDVMVDFSMEDLSNSTRDFADSKSLKNIMTENSDKVGRMTLRYLCSDPQWYYDVVFEVISYRYSSAKAYGGHGTEVEAVELAVYRIISK